LLVIFFKIYDVPTYTFRDENNLEMQFMERYKSLPDYTDYIVGIIYMFVYANVLK